MVENVDTVAGYLLTRLKQLGVTDVFQIPGDYVKNFTTTLENFPGVSTIAGINELDAAYAADAYARTRGLAAVSLQFGVSTFSALNAVAGAYVERSPIVVISATPGSDDRTITDMFGVLYHHSTGNLDADRKVYENVTVGAITLSTNVGAAEAIDALLVSALTHQRPVYIACYEEVWGQPLAQPGDAVLTPRPMTSPPQALANAVDQAWKMIAAARRPVIFAGVEILRFGLADLLQEIIDASGMLYTTTTLGKAVLDEGGDKFLGTYAGPASIDSVRAEVEAADVVLALGAIITDDYLTLIEGKFATMVLSLAEGTRVGYFNYPDVPLKPFMEALLQRFRADQAFPRKDKAPAQPAWPQPWDDNSDPLYADQPEIITYNRFFRQSMRFLERSGMIDEIVMTFGVSSALYVATNAYGLRQGSFVSSAAWQCIGFETGAASGAQLGSGKRAWTVAGDGGFMMVCQALSTLARNKLNAVIFVMSNEVYAIEQVFVNMKAFLPGKDHTFDSFDLLPSWDYLALAKAFGAEGRKVTTIGELDAVLEEIPGIRDTPLLVQVVIPQKDLAGQMRRLGPG